MLLQFIHDISLQSYRRVIMLIEEIGSIFFSNNHWKRWAIILRND